MEEEEKYSKMKEITVHFVGVLALYLKYRLTSI